MTINYKDKFYIYHPDGKFTEEQLIKILDAAYNMGKKDGYNDGYEAGKRNSMTITYPYYSNTVTTPTWDWTKITCTSKSSDTIVPTVTTTSSNNPPSVTTTATAYINTNREFKYNGTER